MWSQPRRFPERISRFAGGLCPHFAHMDGLLSHTSGFPSIFLGPARLVGVSSFVHHIITWIWCGPATALRLVCWHCPRTSPSEHPGRSVSFLVIAPRFPLPYKQQQQRWQLVVVYQQLHLPRILSFPAASLHYLERAVSTCVSGPPWVPKQVSRFLFWVEVQPAQAILIWHGITNTRHGRHKTALRPAGKERQYKP